ncbi:MAG TPA: extracellular solute-binding protein [Candidatus Eisenbergiella merdipullorum]|uniref:Extracellular solute-binding protein n=1 Tax=Candidatus Eisenbergiella merdipullorum TaxID=2838553 RepID=A0A9D2I547_9FIRM|nr:extracellular solute-binding protein [Candidatus Eisenbergiella merdipullorum]
MKRKKQLTAFALAGVMLLTAAGCGKQTADETQPTTAPSSASSEAAATAPENELSWLNSSQTLPIVKEGTDKTLSMYIRMAADSPEPEHQYTYRFIEEGMNINLEVTKMSGDGQAEFLSLAFASNELPDIIIDSQLSADQLVNYGANEGQILDLAPYLNETYMPNLTAIYEEHPEYKSAIQDSEGHIWSVGAIADITDREQVPRAFLNYDLLEELNLEVPETLDEFLDAMRAVKAAYPDDYPIGGSYTRSNPMMYLLNAFGYLTSDAAGQSIALRNGEVVLPVADREAYGEFLKFMNVLYEEGLIHPDFFTMDSNTAKSVVVGGNPAFVTDAPFTLWDDFGGWWGPIPLTSDWNPTPQWPAGNGVLNAGGAVVTSQCEDPELAATFLDYFYTYPTYRLGVMGPLRDTQSEYLFGVGGRYYDESANYQSTYVDVVENPGKWNSNAEYVAQEIQLWNYFVFGDGRYSADLGEPSRAETDPDLSGADDPAELRHTIEGGQKHFELALQNTVCKYVTTDVYPKNVYLDPDVSVEANHLLTAISEYATQESAKFIIGARPLEELDSYFDEIENLGALDYVQIYKDYYESIQ